MPGPVYIEPNSLDLAGMEQWASDAFVDGKKPWLPDEIIELEAPLVLTNRSAKRISTSGRLRYAPDVFDARQELNGGTLFHYTGTAGLAAIELRGCIGLELDPFTLKCASGSKSQGIAITNPAAYGSGNHVFHRPQFLNCTEGAIAGDAANTQANNSECSFYNPSFFDCDYGLVTQADQALNFFIYGFNAARVGGLVKTTRGGAVHIYGGQTYNVDWLFEQGWGGPNAMVNSASGVRLDGGGLSKAQSGWLRTLGSVSGGAMAEYRLDALSDVGMNTTLAESEGNYLIDIAGRVTVNVKGGSTQTPFVRAAGSGEYIASVTADGTRIMGTVGTTYSLTAKTAYFTRRNCFDWRGKPIRNGTAKKVR